LASTTPSLVTDESGCKVKDLNSTKGIYIDDTAVKKRTLMDGDTVTASIHEMIYHDLRDIEEA
jgi:pSer/pThr/pTyr-binding forkhead associated (FHA) protein